MKKLIKYLTLIIIVVFCAAAGIYYYSPGTVITAATEYAKWKGGFETRSIQVGKHKWPYIEAGSKDKETIVFVHGFGSSKELWIGMMDYFGKTYHVIAPDLPGFGKNKIAESVNYTIPDQVERLDKFLATIDVDKFHLMGISMGGYISAYYAIVHQDKLLSLALMDAAGVTSPQESYYLKHLRETNENLLVPEDVEGFKKFMAVVYNIPPKVPDHFAKYFISLRKKRLKQENRLFQGIVKSLENPIEPKLPIIETQTLIMWGDKDRVIDISSVSIFEKGIKNSQTVIFKDIGHVPFLEAPMKTNTAYKKFLTNL